MLVNETMNGENQPLSYKYKPVKFEEEALQIQDFEKIIDPLELSIKSLKEGRHFGFDPSLRKFSIRSSLARHVLEFLFDNWV